MSLEEKGYKKRDTSDLLNWRMQVTDDGSIRITGVTKHGFRQCIENISACDKFIRILLYFSESDTYAASIDCKMRLVKREVDLFLRQARVRYRILLTFYSL